MKYILTDQYQPLVEKEGAIENRSSFHTLHLASATTTPDGSIPFVEINKGDTQNFKALDGETMYAKIVKNENYPTLEISVVTFIPEQLQNCYELPHPSLDYALFVENGELKEWSKDGVSKLKTLEQVGNGDKDTRSLNGKGLNGIIGQDNLHIGKGYRNEWNNLVTGVTIIDGVTVMDSNGWKICKPAAGVEFSLTFRLLEYLNPNDSGGTRINVSSSRYPESEIFVKNIVELEINKTYEWKLGLAQTDAEVSIFIADGVTVKAEICLTKTSFPVPYIKDSIPDGRCVLDADWTSANRSFIFSGFAPSSEQLFFKLSNSVGNQSSQESFYISQADSSKIYDAIFSDLYTSVFEDDGTIYTGGVGFTDRGISGGVVSLTRNIEYGGRANDFKGVYVYSLEITKEGLEEDLAKWKAGKIKLDPMGFVENIPNSKKRMDKSGILKTHIEVTIAEKDEDIYPAIEGYMLELIDSSGVSYISVGVDGTIPTGKLKNVAGYIRSDETNAVYPFKIRVVK
ncbi:MAG: hypothetical protein WBG30_08955 [Psychrilyobacter sp.]|uniref:hypothetical protein n=1 Tax=Psychrilyobacter sp. TaxID=2586924 RepID=UPI003C72F202